MKKNTTIEHTTYNDTTYNNATYKQYANGSPEESLSKRGYGIAELILRVEILKFEKIDFWPKIYESSLEDL